jgi:hypothetical protein
MALACFVFAGKVGVAINLIHPLIGGAHDHFRAETKHLAGSKLLRYATVKRLAT